MSRIVIVVEGGIIQNVMANDEDINPTEVIVLDRDIEGADEDDISTVFIEDVAHEVFVSTPEVQWDVTEVESIFEQVNKNKEEAQQ